MDEQQHHLAFHHSELLQDNAMHKVTLLQEITASLPFSVLQVNASLNVSLACQRTPKMREFSRKSVLKHYILEATDISYQ